MSAPILHSLPHVRDIAAYQPGKPISQLSRELGIPEHSIIKLASNENPLGMSPKAKAALIQAANEAYRYPDQFDLINALAKKLKLDSSMIVLGNGSNDVLDLAARTFLGANRSAVMSRHAFAVYSLATKSAGAQCITTEPDKYFGHDLNAMQKAIQSNTRLIWIANPNNPTGTFIAHKTLYEFLKKVPEDIMVILDEAYNEYLPSEHQSDTVFWIKEFPNLLITRTFSKVYGLAGLRIGYALAHEKISNLLNRIRHPFNVNNLALAAALAALDDHDFVKQSYQINQAGLKQIKSGLQQLGLRTLPAHGNFISFQVEDKTTTDSAIKCHALLLHQGIIVRSIAYDGLPAWLRVTIGTESQNKCFLSALKQALEQINYATR